MKRAFATGNEDGITAVACPKCDSAMERMDGGYSESFVGGAYDQVEDSDYWRCPACGYCMDESQPDPMTDEDWGRLIAEGV